MNVKYDHNLVKKNEKAKELHGIYAKLNKIEG